MTSKRTIKTRKPLKLAHNTVRLLQSRCASRGSLPVIFAHTCLVSPRTVTQESGWDLAASTPPPTSYQSAPPSSDSLLGNAPARAAPLQPPPPQQSPTAKQSSSILQDCKDGMGVCFLDPHGDAIQDILKRLPQQRVNDVILLDVLDTKYPFGLNLYECSDPEDLELAARTCEQVMHVFQRL